MCSAPAVLVLRSSLSPSQGRNIAGLHIGQHVGAERLDNGATCLCNAADCLPTAHPRNDSGDSVT
eukprot:13071139-Alexandrium_andersonii.AAC.1